MRKGTRRCRTSSFSGEQIINHLQKAEVFLSEGRAGGEICG